MGTPGAPALVADSLTSSSVRLEWEEPKVPNLTYLVQWRYESAPTWQYCRNHTWIGHGSTVLVENLKPFTFYRFRVAILLPAHLAEPLVSEPSLVIGTLPGGPPSSPPSSVRAIATDPTRVSVSWKPGPFPNGPILSYVLSIDELPRGYKGHKVSIFFLYTIILFNCIWRIIR
ncbi:hypothetical protein AAG570_009093 [Ranatra chinensis]|uniref:Fibronectin type-III domain-containing protein n=1 Tax=Ranatra chinensis TaxID=642074 RepID=A0ABD0Z3F1_9HEMI